MQLHGTLDKFPLRELIEMVVYSSVTGALEVQINDTAGQIFFRDGLPYHAEVGDIAGFEAVCQMFEQRDSVFRFVADVTLAEETLWLDPWELIERGEQMAKIWMKLRPLIPDLHWVPVMCGSTNSDQIHISEDIWQVLSSIDGQRSVAAIAQYLELAPLDVCRALVALLKQKLIVMRPPVPTIPPPLPSSHTPAAAGNGFFERLIAKTLADQDHNGAPQPPANPQGESEQSDSSSRYVYYPRRK